MIMRSFSHIVSAAIMPAGITAADRKLQLKSLSLTKLLGPGGRVKPPLGGDGEYDPITNDPTRISFNLNTERLLQSHNGYCGDT